MTQCITCITYPVHLINDSIHNIIGNPGHNNVNKNIFNNINDQILFQAATI